MSTDFLFDLDTTALKPLGDCTYCHVLYYDRAADHLQAHPSVLVSKIKTCVVLGERIIQTRKALHLWSEGKLSDAELVTEFANLDASAPQRTPSLSIFPENLDWLHYRRHGELKDLVIGTSEC